MTTGLVHHARCLEHDSGQQGLERAERLVAVLERLESSGLASQAERLEPPMADDAALELVHGSAHVREVRAACAAGPTALDWDTRVVPASMDAARLAAGGVVAAVDAVVARRWDNAFVAVRPPGHHAEASRAMGFCLFNNVAVAARHAQRRHGIERVAIVDFDVHHGNGTQHLFEDDPTVFYASLHQHPHYPGTGLASERGTGDGEGATLNCPLAAGTGDREWLGALERVVLPALEAFAPELVLVSAGFDAHVRDPLSGTEVTTDAYRRMTEALVGLARGSAGGKLVSALEGGYDLVGIAEAAEAHVASLLEA